jgi:hypothetical protein
VRRFLAEKPLRQTENPVLEAVVTALVKDCGHLRDKALEPVEAKHCRAVFQAIEDHYPDEALGDVGFWSYLAVRYFWEFISLRQAKAWAKVQGVAAEKDPESSESDEDRVTLDRYFLGKDHYHLPLRMYLRAQAVRDGDSFDLTVVKSGTVDFWRSHILGVRTAMYPPLARSVAALQDARQLDTPDQRAAARTVNRLRANIDFVQHSEGEARELVDPIWVGALGEQPVIAKRSTRRSGSKDSELGENLAGAFGKAPRRRSRSGD